MSEKCIENAVKAGKISKDVAKKLYRDIDRFAEDSIGADTAYAQWAVKKALENRKIELAVQRKNAAADLLKRIDLDKQVDSHVKGKAKGVMSTLVKDLSENMSLDNIYYNAKGILGGLHSMVAETMGALRTRTAGLTQDVNLARDTVLEIQGKDTGNAAAKAHAKDVNKMFDKAREMFNAAGGNISKLENWWPHSWDSKLVSKISKEEFIEKFLPAMDRQKMRNDLDLPMNDKELGELLDAAYDSITTGGMNKMKPGQRGTGKLGNKHQEHRVLIFKDPEEWMVLNDEFGRNDFYVAMTDHMDRMALEIALMEKYGTNPELTFQYLKDKIAIEEGTKGKKAHLAFIESVWNVTSGRVNQAQHERFGNTMQAARAVQVATDLGSAALSSITDIPSIAITARYNGLPVMKIFGRALKVMVSSKAKVQAIQMGLPADAFTSKASAANRYADINGQNWATNLADFVVRASGLAPWTDSLRTAYGMIAMEAVSTHSGKAFKELPDSFRNSLKRYNISPEDWNKIRSTGMDSWDGEAYFAIDNMMARTDLDVGEASKLVAKVKRMIDTETDYAVLMPDDRMRAIVTGGQQKGSVAGELFRSAFMYKTFPMLIISNHLYRAASQGALSSKLSYLAHLSIGTTIFGGMALQLKDVTKGRELRDMTTPEFWGAAYAQGGGAGIFGDFFFADVNRFGHSMIETLAGPLAMTAQDTFGLGLGNVQEFASGEKMNLGADISNFARRHTPGASLWYTRAVFERTVLDTLQNLIDPKAAGKFKRKIKSRKTQYDQGFWWNPGELLPEEGIDITKAIGK